MITYQYTYYVCVYCDLYHTAGTTGQAITATHDSFLMYSEVAEEARSWILAISKVINEVCWKLSL